MGNYDDWDPEWRPVGDPVPTDDGSNDYGSNDYDASGESGPSEPSLSGMDTADLEASEPTLGEAWAALRQRYEAPGVGASGVAIEPESPDEVVKGWRARLELPDPYGPAELGSDESGSDQPYPDESERAQHRPADVGPTMPTDWASVLAATPHGAPQPYELEPSSQPPPENWYTLEEGAGKPIWTPKATTQGAPTFLQSEQQRLKGSQSLPQDLGNAWEAFLRFAGLSPDAPAPKPTPALPPNWDQMTPGEKLQWGMANREHAPSIPELVGAGISDIARANEYLAKRTPGVGGATKLITEEIPNAVGVFPRIGGYLMQETEARPEFTSAYLSSGLGNLTAGGYMTPQQVEQSIKGVEELKRNPPTWPEIEKELQQAPSVWREKAPLPVQILSDLFDPGYGALGKALEAPKVLSQAGKWDVIKTALESQGLESHVPVVKQTIKDAGGWGSKGASRVLKEADELFVAPATAAKAREGKDLLLKVLNEKRAPGAVPFQSLDDVAKRADEATAILRSYLASEGGIPKAASVSGEAGGALSTEPTLAPPRSQPRGVQVSTNAVVPSPTNREIWPSTNRGSVKRVGSIESSSKRIILQESADINANLQRARQAQSSLDDIGSHLRGDYRGSRIKESGRIAQKVRAGQPAETISDYLGGRLAVDSIDDARAVVADLEQHGLIVHVEDFLSRPRHGGYRAIHAQIAMPNGSTAELQIVPREIADVQEKAHSFYGVFRDPAASQAAVEAAIQQSQQVFNEAWTKFERRSGFFPAERAPESAVPLSAIDVPSPSGVTAATAARIAAAIATAARAARGSDRKSRPKNESTDGTKREPDPRAIDASGALKADTPRMVLQYMRQRLSHLGYTGAMIDQLKPSEAAQIIAEGRPPQVRGAESPSGQGSGRGAAPGGVGSGRLDVERQLNRPSGRRPVRSQVPLSLSQQMAQLYRGTVAGDGYRGERRATEHDAWAMVPDDLKAALEDYWQGERLTRAEVQRLMPVYRRYVAQTGDPGDMVEWVTATLREQRYPPRRAGGRAHATTRIAA